MFDQLTCLARAAACHRKAATAISADARFSFRDAEIRWLSLADSYRSDCLPDTFYFKNLERRDLKDMAPRHRGL
jgi:hypothetical protein